MSYAPDWNDGKIGHIWFCEIFKNHHQFESVPEINEWAIFSMHIIFSEEIWCKIQD